MKFPTGCPDHYGLKEEPKSSRGCTDCEACWEEAILSLEKAAKTNEEYIHRASTEELVKFFCEKAVEIDCIAGNPCQEEDFKEWLKEEYEK